MDNNCTLFFFGWLKFFNFIYIFLFSLEGHSEQQKSPDLKETHKRGSARYMNFIKKKEITCEDLLRFNLQKKPKQRN